MTFHDGERRPILLERGREERRERGRENRGNEKKYLMAE